MRFAFGGRAAFLAGLLGLAQVAGAAEAGRLADNHVVVTPPEAQIHDEEGQPVDTIDAGTVLEVFETKGDRVRVNRGWLPAAAVIPYDQAVEHFSKEIAKQATATAYSARARVRCYHGDFDKALADCNEALKLDPESVSAYARRGRAWAGKGELDKALADYNEALRLDPDDAHAYAHRARAYLERGEYELAVNDCNEALRRDPKSNVALYYRGRARAARGDIDRAVADFDKALRLNPLYVPAYNSRANERFLQRKYREAIADYSEAIRLNPTFDMVHIHYNRGNAYFRLGDSKQAAADYQEALKHSSSYLPAIEALAQCHAKLGDYGAAAEWQAKAVALTAKSGQSLVRARLEKYQASQASRRVDATAADAK